MGWGKHGAGAGCGTLGPGTSWEDARDRRAVWAVCSLPKPAFANDCVSHDLTNSKAVKILPFAPILTSGCSSQRK